MFLQRLKPTDSSGFTVPVVVAQSVFLLCVSLLLASVPVRAERHSLYYTYTALSKDLHLPGIYKFTAMGLLNDRQIDYFNSQDQKKIPKQPWMESKMEKDYWDKGTTSRRSKQQWFDVNLGILMDRMRENSSDVHVLQWRHGCEIQGDHGQFTFSKGIDEYSYDGRNFLSFNDEDSQWVAPVYEAQPTKNKWDRESILNHYTKGYLEKECVDWLNKFRSYGDAEIKKESPPDVHIYAMRSIHDKSKLKLTCLATGFYPKDVLMQIRKFRAPLPENQMESSGVRPNHDETYQLKISVEIREDEAADYDCWVSHQALTEPIVERWDGKCRDCSGHLGIGIGIGIGIGALGVILLAGVGYFLYKTKKLVLPRGINDGQTKDTQINGSNIVSATQPFLPNGEVQKTAISNGSESQQILTNGSEVVV